VSAKKTDVHVASISLYFLPVTIRVPLKFGRETLTSVTCARVRMKVQDLNGRTAEGWGETPLSVQWAWPSSFPYEERHEALKTFCIELAGAWADFDAHGHPIEVGHKFQEAELPRVLERLNEGRAGSCPIPWLAALVCCSPFDIALHDAYGVLHRVPVYETYSAEYMNVDLSFFLEGAREGKVRFAGKYPADFLSAFRADDMPAWHLVGGKDPLEKSELAYSDPDDGYPILLRDWIRRDGLKCLKVKLRGDDSDWDFERLAKVGQLAAEEGVHWLSCDFNCTVRDPSYVNDILDRLLVELPRIYGMILYVEQPFPYDLETEQIDVHSVSARKPLFMDESCDDWRSIRLGRQLGWTGAALKTCKTQTGSLLTLCWAKAHGIPLMVQDLTNPMLAQIPHCLLAAHAGTIMGLETNSMQFYPEASLPEAAVHSGLYRRRNGKVSLSTLTGPGFGYRMAEMHRHLPAPVIDLR